MTGPAFRARELARLKQLLRAEGLLLVYGPDSQEAIDLVSAAVPARTRPRTATVDVDLCESSGHLASTMLRASADVLAGDDRLLDVPEDRLTPEQHRRVLAVRRALGSDFDALRDPPMPPREASNPARLAALAISALATRPSGRYGVILRGADSLLEVPRTRFDQPAELLWSMRAAAQGAPRVRLVLVGGPAAAELVSADDAAFRGWGRPFELERLDPLELGNAVSSDRGLDPIVARRIAELSEGLPRVAERVARRAEEEGRHGATGDVAEAAWASLLQEDASALRVTTRLISDLHRAALPVCRALARSRAPYSVARSTEVTRALRLLHVRGLCESPAPRSWRLTDPLLASWLRSDDTTTRHR